MERFQNFATADLVRALDREIRSRGYGSISQLERALGEKTGWWHYRARAGSLKLEELFAVLNHLGLHPSRFLRRHLSDDGDLELDRPRGAMPAIVRRALERYRAGLEGPGVGGTFLDSLDERRHDHPREVAQTVQTSVELVELAALPRLLAITGSCFRLMRLFDEAEHALHAGLDIARDRGDRIGVGNLARRLSYVIASRGSHGSAFDLSLRATNVLLREGDLVGVSKGLVEQGMWLFYLERWQEAISSEESALDLLPEELHRYRFTALQTLGLAHSALGSTSEARQHLQLAEAHASGLGLRDRAKLSWLQAELCLKERELEEAEALLCAAVSDLKRCHAGEAALATCDLVQVQLHAGKAEQAFLSATSMLALLEPLKQDALLSAAIAELLRGGREGLTLALVTRVKARIEGERSQGRRWSELAIQPG